MLFEFGLYKQVLYNENKFKNNRFHLGIMKIVV